MVSVSNSNGETAAIFSKLGNVNMDLDGVEGIESRALGGTDHGVIGDLARTDLTSADLDLRGLSGGATTRPTPSRAMGSKATTHSARSATQMESASPDST